MKKLIVPVLLAGLAGCGKAEPTAKTKTEEPQVIRKDGWVVTVPHHAVCKEQAGEITVIEHGTVTIIRFGPEIPDPRPQPKVPPIPPPVVPPFPPAGPAIPPSSSLPPSSKPRVPPPEGEPILPPVPPPARPVPDSLPLPSPLPLPGKLPLPGTLPLPSPGQ